MKRIRQGEGLTLEFKTCQNGLNRDIYQTVCAYLNRHGGTLLLGIDDTGEVVGIDPNRVAQIKKDFATAINNPQKINPPCYLSVNDLSIGEKAVLRIYVPESSQVHRCNGRIFDRNEDGDLDITDHTQMVTNLYLRKQATYSENKLYPYATLNDLRDDLIAKVRKIAGIQRKDHPWLVMDDLELLKSAQLYQTDFQTGKDGITLAGILLLGKDEAILSVVPHHRTDLILRRINLDRYDDRDDVRTNLIESYERIMAFIAKHLPDPFYLEGDTRINIRDAIFREVASNILIHREFLNPFPAKLIIEQDRVRTENSNKPHGFGPINPASFSPFPKNPVIARFFKEIGRADELGSGVRNLMKYGKTYGGINPELIEGDIFQIIVRYPDYGRSFEQTAHEGAHEGAHEEAHEGAHEGLTNAEWQILNACLNEPKNISEILTLLGYKTRTGSFKRSISLLLELGLLEQTLPESPRSKKQKYRLTEKGRKLIHRVNGQK